MGKKLKTIDPLAEVRATPLKVKHLMLNPAASRNMGQGLYDPYPAFPREILACKNLVELEIFRGISDDGELPKELGTLTKLKSLSLGGLPTTKLPDSIGNLANLETLSLAYMESLEVLPRSIGKLTKLRALDAPYAALTSLPPLGTLRALRKASFGRTALTAIPSSLWQCTALEELHLPDTVEQLPAGIAKLAKLRVLSVSAKALASIARELPKLKLHTLFVDGDATQLPEELGRIETLRELNAGHLGLTSLPASLPALAQLTELAISGNKLATVIDIVAQLPKLETLDYSGNPVAISERREVDKLMKLAPHKRAAHLARRPQELVTRPKQTPKPALARIGRVASVNASLSLIIADAAVAKAWSGVGESEDLDGSDWERARQALAKKDYAMLDVGSAAAVALSLGVGQGVADVFRIGERIVVVESIADDTEDALFLEFVASTPKQPKSVANLAVPSKKLVMVPTTDAGDSDESLALDVPAKIAISIEAEVKSSWGQARRFFVSPA